MQNLDFNNRLPILGGASVFFVLMCFLVMPAGADVGYINTLNGPQSAFSLTRNGKRMLAAPQTPLKKDDKICVRKPTNEMFPNRTNSIELALGNNQFITLKGEPQGEKCFTVEGSDSSNTLLNNIMDITSKWLGKLWGESVQELMTALSKGAEDETIPLTIPLLQDGNAKLLAGKQALHLVWKGGNLPYQVQLYRNGTEVWWAGNIKDAKPLRERYIENVVTATINLTNPLATGRYQLKIDGVEAYFTVVANSPLLSSQEAQAIPKSNLPLRNQQTLLAAWLVQKGQDEWNFEAYQRVAKIIEEYYPAFLVVRKKVK